MTDSAEAPSLEDFLLSLTGERPSRFSPPLSALWFDAKNDWQAAHHCVDARSDVASMRTHAYLHRKEGDLINAGYWYRRAGLHPYQGALADEWLEIVKMLCN
jgi:hypothetical protein